jgi:hypothetical protein
MTKRLVGLSIFGAIAVASCSDASTVVPEFHSPVHGGDASGSQTDHDGSISGNPDADSNESPDSASPDGSTIDPGSPDAAAHDAALHDSGAHDAARDTSVPDSGGVTVQQICVDEINRYRATNGKPPYARWPAAESCADSEAKSDSKTGTAHGAFGTCHEFAQDECPGWPGPMEKMIKDCLKAMWDEGPGGGHYDIMNSDNYTQAACGFYTLPNGKIWAAQDFK